MNVDGTLLEENVARFRNVCFVKTLIFRLNAQNFNTNSHDFLYTVKSFQKSVLTIFSVEVHTLMIGGKFYEKSYFIAT